MSNNWSRDIAEMHEKYKVNDWVNKKIAQGDMESLKTFLGFRINFLIEELVETQKAYAENDPEEVVDGLIDLCVVAIGTLDAFGVDANVAWDQVHKANMSKQVGVKESRPNPLGLPDLIKPAGWVPPTHKGNHGLLTVTLQESV
jgi:predicted HAD superfamily Cof-like phosphohydrolase